LIGSHKRNKKTLGAVMATLQVVKGVDTNSVAGTSQNKLARRDSSVIDKEGDSTIMAGGGVFAGRSGTSSMSRLPKQDQQIPTTIGSLLARK